MKARLWMSGGGLLVALTFGLGLASGQQVEDKTEAGKVREDIRLREQILKRQFEEFERSLLQLKQRLERSSKEEDRQRAKVLQKVLEQARDASITTQFEQMIDFLRKQKLTNVGDINIAMDRANKLADDLRALLALMREDPRTVNLTEKRKELEALIKRIDKAIHDQRVVQGQTDLGKTDRGELKKNQEKVTKDVGDIAKTMSGKDGQGGEGKNPHGNAKPGEKGGEGKSGESKDAGKGGEGKSAEAKAGGKGGEASAKGDQSGKEGKGGEGGEGKAKSGGEGKEGAQAGAKGSKGGEGEAGGKKGGMGGSKEAGGSKDGSKEKGGDPSGAKGGKGGEKGGDKSGGEKGGSKSAGKGGEGSKGAGAKGSKGGEGQSGSKAGGSKSSQGQAKSGSKSGGQSSSKSGGQEGGQQGGEQGQAKQDPNQKGGPQGGNQDPKDEVANSKKRVQDAEYKQKQAEEKIAGKDNKGASDDQGKAIDDLEQAKKKLEELLRQTREEELERLLAALQARCEKMLAMQQQVLAGTEDVFKAIQATVDRKPERDHQQRSLKLSDQEKEIVIEATKAIEMLEAEGSAVAFPEVFQQVREDMKHVQRRLEVTDAGQVTQAIERDIIDTLKEMIEALKKARQEQQQGKPGQPKEGKSNPNQDQKLLDQIAELKMIRSMQLRVNARTKTYGRLYEGEQAADANVGRELRNLSERQERIYEITIKIAKGENR